MKNYTWLAVVLLVGGAGCIFGGVSIFLDNQTFFGTAVITQATVSIGGEKGGTGSGMQASFVLEDGSSKTVGLAPQFSHKEGDSVLVAYQPSNPDKARIYTFWEMNVAPACLFTIGLLLTGAGIFTFTAAYPGRRERAYDSALEIPAELLKDKVVAEAFARDPMFGKQVRVNVQEHVEIKDSVTGEKQVYNSSDEVPPDIQAKLDAIRDRYRGAKTPGASTQTFTFRNESASEVKTYHSLDEALPDIQAKLDAIRDRYTGAKTLGVSTQTYTFRDEATGEVKTYHSLDEMPPEVRRFFENVGKGEGPSLE